MVRINVLFIMSIFLWLFNVSCLPPITQVARKDVGSVKPRQQNMRPADLPAPRDKITTSPARQNDS